jgi:hypothetical protein
MSFVHAAAPNVRHFPTVRRGERLPLRLRTAIILGSAAGLWAVLLFAGYYIIGAFV